MTSNFEIYREGRMGTTKKLLLASMAAAVITLPTLAQPAPAQPTGPGVRDGKNISVFHNLDFVAAFGYESGERLTVDVYRGGHKIATAFGPAAQTPEGPGLEVNHGPVGAAAQGDCWENYTPDILPGDRIVVTDGAGVTDEVLVDGISINEEGPIDTDPTSRTAPVTLEGRASYADGTPIPVESLDSGELRHDGPRFRATPNSVERIEGTEDGWRATYQYPYNIVQIKESLTAEEKKQAVLNGSHAMGYGHVAPLPKETQLVEGIGGGGPALGCEVSPKQANAVTISDDEFVNLDSGPLNLSGTAMEAVSAVDVTLSDADPATDDVTVDATGLTAGPGEKAWSAEFSREQLDSLEDGELTASGTYTLSAGGETTGANKQIQKDTVAPADPTATPPGGSYDAQQAVSLNAEDGSKAHYTVDGSDPSATSREFGQQIQITASQSIKALAVDAAGNSSGISTFDYVIRRASDLGLKAGTGTVDFGKTTKLNGTLTADDKPLADKEVTLIKRAIGERKFSNVPGGTVTTDSESEFSKQIKPRKNTYYRAKFSGGQEFKASTGGAERVNVRADVSLNVLKGRLPRGERIGMVGIVRPAHAGDEVKLIIKRGSQRVQTKTVILDEKSRYKFVYSPKRVGNYNVKAILPKQDADHLGDSSQLERFKVTRR